MKNFINSRIQGFNNNKIIGMIEHALRVVKSRNQRNSDMNYLYDIETNQTIKVVYLTKNEQSKLSDKDLANYKKDRKILLNYYNKMKSLYNEHRTQHNELHKARKRGENLKNGTGSWAEGVLTFSEQIQSDYNNNKLDINKFFKNGIKTIKETCEYLGAELINVTLHLDEKTPHFHYTFKSFDKKGMSLTHNSHFKRNNLSLSNLQDIAANGFKDFGIQRGIEKAISGRTRHQKTIEYYEKLISEKNLELKEQQKKIEDLENNATLVKESLINEIEVLSNKVSEFDEISKKHKTLKQNIKLLAKEFDIDNIEKKEIFDIIDDIRRNLISISKEVETLKKKLQNGQIKYDNLKQDYQTTLIKFNAANKANKINEENLLKLINKNSNLVGLVDKDSLISDLMSCQNLVADGRFKAMQEENQKLNKYLEHNKKINSNNDQLSKDLSNASRQLDNYKHNNDELTKENDSLKQDNQKSKQIIDKQEKELNKANKTINKLKRSRESILLKSNKKFRESKQAQKIRDKRNRERSVRQKQILKEKSFNIER